MRQVVIESAIGTSMLGMAVGVGFLLRAARRAFRGRTGAGGVVRVPRAAAVIAAGAASSCSGVPHRRRAAAAGGRRWLQVAQALMIPAAKVDQHKQADQQIAAFACAIIEGQPDQWQCQASCG